MGACRTTGRAILSGGRGGVATTTLCGALPDHREERSEAVAHGQLKPILVPHADTPRWYPAFADRAPSAPACVSSWPRRQVRSKSPAGTRSGNADPDGPASLARLRGHTRASPSSSRYTVRCRCDHPGKARCSLRAYARAYPGRSRDHARSLIGHSADPAMGG
jgi:hypothetical protein